MRQLLIILEGEPRGKGRPRASSAGGFVRMYTPKTTKEAEDEIKAEAVASMRGVAKFTGPVAVEMQIFHGIRQSWTKAKKAAARANEIAPTIKVDIDNCAKLFFDAFNGVVWDDDVQVVQLTASKQFSDTPCVMVTVRALDLRSA